MPDSLKIDLNVEIPLRDGVKTRADVYRPDDTSKHPVLLARLPYSKDLSPISLSLLSPIRAAKKGYVVVIQDTRGRFKSDGQFSLFVGEAEDGYDTVAWCAVAAVVEWQSRNVWRVLLRCDAVAYSNSGPTSIEGDGADDHLL